MFQAVCSCGYKTTPSHDRAMISGLGNLHECVKKVAKGLPYMGDKARLGAKASHANQHGSYDQSLTERKEAEIASRVDYLNWDDDFLRSYTNKDNPIVIVDEKDLPPVRREIWDIG